MVSLRPCRTFRGPAFDRVDATLSRVDNTPDLTLPDFERRRSSIRCARGASLSVLRLRSG
jgi:hypothetical protein